MSDATDRTAARARLIALVEPTVTPALTTTAGGEIDTILDHHRRATMWAVNTAYVYGAVVLPTVRNGHRYKCVEAGTSAALAADEPSWLKCNAARLTDGLTSGDTVMTWEEDGPDYANIYDVRAAAHEAWMLKAAKVSKNFNLKIGSLGFDLEQVYRHCLEMANKYAPLSFG